MFATDSGCRGSTIFQFHYRGKPIKSLDFSKGQRRPNDQLPATGMLSFVLRPTALGGKDLFRREKVDCGLSDFALYVKVIVLWCVTFLIDLPSAFSYHAGQRARHTYGKKVLAHGAVKPVVISTHFSPPRALPILMAMISGSKPGNFALMSVRN